jgi:hypothetical protein
MNPTSPELHLILQQKSALLSAKVAAIRNDGMPFYSPHPKQDAFHRATTKRRGAFCGNRFGKSHMGCAEDSAWLRGERTWYSRSDPARRSGIPQHPVKGLVVTTDWDKVDEIWTSQRGEEGKLWKMLPKDGFVKKVGRNHSGVICTVECANKSILRFDTVKSWMSNPQGSESSDWDFVHIDEPCPEGMWKAISRGLVDRNGSAWFTLTALREPWITDAFTPNGMFDGSSWMIYGTIYDNPYLSKDAIAAFELTLSDDEKECRLNGKPLHLAGLVYKEFSPSDHILTAPPVGWKDFATPPAFWPTYIYIDPHPRTPHMVLFCVVDPFGRRYYYDDVFAHKSIADLCNEEILPRLRGRNFIRGRIDPLAFIPDPIDPVKCMAEEFHRHGIRVEKATKALSQGILRVQGNLRTRPPEMFFSPNAKRTLWEIGRYHWDEESNKPVDKDDHAMECLYRAELDDPRWVDPYDHRLAIEDEVISAPRLDLAELNFT